MIATALGGPGAGLIASKLSQALGVSNDPDDILNYLKANPEAVLEMKLTEIEADKETTLAALEATTKQLETVNRTMRAETNSDDSFVRRWRPFYGYAVAVSWFIQMTGLTFVICYTAIKNPTGLPLVLTQLAAMVASLMTLWGIALAVLGVSVRARSAEKRNEPKGKGLIATLLNK